MSPQLKTVEEAGIKALLRKNQPDTITASDFTEAPEVLKQGFSELIDNPNPEKIAIIPSVSYGIANVANNVKLNSGDEILVVSEQFPSNIYSWQNVAKKYKAHIKIVAPPKEFKGRGARWNKDILEAISSKTAVVAMAHLHWADGTLFDLQAIREKTTAVQALLIIDGTQSIGALPFSVKELQPDALICGGYKWLLGPYSLGVAYYGDTLLQGEPIEHGWLNRLHSENFTTLTQYQDAFQPGAARYSVGESSNFTLVPMLIKSIEQLIAWQPQQIQEYCKTLAEPAIAVLRNKGYLIEEEAYRSSHLFGIYMPEDKNIATIKEKLIANNIMVSYRGNAIRVSSHLYNDVEDFKRLVHAF